MLHVPTVGFETSAINKLEKDGSRAEALMAALRCGFHVRLPAMSADEILSDPDVTRREATLAICQRLLSAGECLWPPHEILRLLISDHFQNPPRFDWTRTNIRARIYKQAIIGRDFSDDLCAKQRKEQFKVEASFKKLWSNLRPKLNDVLRTDSSKR